MTRLINLASKENETVLDPFMGGGSTGIAALKNGRKFIGIECDEEYFNIAVERMTAAYNELKKSNAKEIA